MEISSDRPVPVNAANITPTDSKSKRKTLSKSTKAAEASKQAAEPAPKKVTITTKARKSAPKAATKPAPTVEAVSDIEIVSQQLLKIPVSELSSETLRSMIATAAYYLAEQRHFAPGMELNDWLTAERQFLHAAH